MNSANWVSLALGLPAFAACYFSWRGRLDRQASQQTEFGTELAKTAFDSLEAQVQSLTNQMRAHAKEAEGREARVGELTHQLHITNMYLQQLLVLLDINGITRPPAPVGLNLAS